MRRWVIRTLIAALVPLTVGFYFIENISDGQKTIRLKDRTFNVSIARTDEERIRGLSNSNALPDNQAMLFVFPENTKPRIWMKDMSYPIDILWLNTKYQVIYLVKNALPESYPQVFQPTVPARYVIEVPSGTIEKTGTVKSDYIKIPLGL